MLKQKFSATKCATISCNVSYKDEIDEKTLVLVLSGGQDLKKWESHIDVFFNELPQEFILGVAEENNLTLDSLNHIFKQLPSQGRNFKELFYAN